MLLSSYTALPLNSSNFLKQCRSATVIMLRKSSGFMSVPQCQAQVFNQRLWNSFRMPESPLVQIEKALFFSHGSRFILWILHRSINKALRLSGCSYLTSASFNYCECLICTWDLRFDTAFKYHVFCLLVLFNVKRDHDVVETHRAVIRKEICTDV